MTISPLEEQQQQQQRQINWQSLTTEEKSNMLHQHVLQDQGARIYFGVHTRVRQILYVKTYLAENFNRAAMLDIVKESYIPMLVRDFAKWERSNGSKMG